MLTSETPIIHDGLRLITHSEFIHRILENKYDLGFASQHKKDHNAIISIKINFSHEDLFR